MIGGLALPKTIGRLVEVAAEDVTQEDHSVHHDWHKVLFDQVRLARYGGVDVTGTDSKCCAPTMAYEPVIKVEILWRNILDEDRISIHLVTNGQVWIILRLPSVFMSCDSR